MRVFTERNSTGIFPKKQEGAGASFVNSKNETALAMDGVVHHPKGALSDADSSFFADVGVAVDTAGYAELFFFAVPVSVQVVVVCFPAGADVFVCDSHRFVPGFVEGQKKIERKGDGKSEDEGSKYDGQLATQPLRQLGFCRLDEVGKCQKCGQSKGDFKVNTGIIVKGLRNTQAQEDGSRSTQAGHLQRLLFSLFGGGFDIDIYG